MPLTDLPSEAIEPLADLPVSPSTGTALAALHAAILSIDDERASMTEAGDYTNLAYGLAQLRALTKALSIATRAVETDLAAVMPEKKLDIEGLGRIERRMSRTRANWDWDRLLPTLIGLSLDPDGTGVLGSAPEVVARMHRLIVDCLGVTPSRAPKLTAVRAMGVDPDEWCESTPNRPSVQITGSVD